MTHKAVFDLNGEKHILTLGLGFLQKLNERYTTNMDGLPVQGLALPRSITELRIGNPIVVRDILELATSFNAKPLSVSEIDEWICEQLEDEATEAKMFEDFFNYLKIVPNAKKFIKEIEAQEAKKAQSSPSEETTETEQPKKKATKK